jgi:hypothetical protein
MRTMGSDAPMRLTVVGAPVGGGPTTSNGATEYDRNRGERHLPVPRCKVKVAAVSLR